MTNRSSWPHSHTANKLTIYPLVSNTLNHFNLLLYLKIKDLRNLIISQAVHKTLYTSATPTVLTLQSNMNIHQHNTRQNQNLHVPKYITTTGQQTLDYIAPTLWNSLPYNIQQITNIHTFTKHAKTHLISKYHT